MSGLLTRCITQALGLLFLASALPASAAIVINNTRVIYPQNEREITVRIDNQGKGPVLLQSWIDDGDARALPDGMHVPFVLTPPVNRIDAGKSQSVRIRYTGRSLPSDRESLFWLNALEIPARQKSVESQNLLQMAFRTRIKLFFRPDGLKGEPETAGRTLRWEADPGQVTAVNDTPWHVSLLSIHVLAGGKPQTIEGDTVAPFSRRAFTVSGHGRSQVSGWQYINDYGAIQDVNTDSRH